MVASEGVTTLEWFRRRRSIKAERGGHGRGKNQSGARGGDVYLDVPVGTLVLGSEGSPIADLVEAGQGLLIAAGGRGGRGNKEFATPTNRIPLLGEEGEAGEKVDAIFEVKLIADLGIVGKPNAGKSTLLGQISRARPEEAAYPFTTKEPVAGVVVVGYDAFVAVEIPGLLEGAHEGVGLGHEFLRHIERTRLLLHMVDGAENDPVGDLYMVRREMEEFDAALANKPYVIAVNKADMPEVQDRRTQLRKTMEAASGEQVTFISAATGEGVDSLVKMLYGRLADLRQKVEPAPMLPSAAAVPRKVERVSVTRREDAFVVAAPEAERLLALPNLDDWRARLQLHGELAQLGVLEALEGAGVRIGDMVVLGEYAFEWE